MLRRAQKIDRLTDLIGGTPMVQLVRVPAPDSAELWGKCEQFNPGGSVKDRLVLTMPESMSLERRALLKAYGAELILTPEERVMEGAVDHAERLCRKNPSFFMPQQFRNPANPEAHRRTTAKEILAQLDGRVPDAFVSAVGTCGTI